MKRILSFLLCGVMAMTLFASCGKDDQGAGSGVSGDAGGTVGGSSQTASNATAAEVFDAIDKAFADKYADLEVGGAIPNMPMDVDDTTLSEKFGIDVSEVESYKGQIAGMMTNCDMLIVVKAKDGKIDSVVTGLNKAKENQTAQFESYGVMGNLERLDASKVVTNGNYAALLMVGIMNDDSDTVDFTEDVKLAEDTFNDAVNG